MRRSTPPHVDFLAKHRAAKDHGSEYRLLLRALVEGLSIALTVGFLVSVLANSIVFAGWGLSFLQVASTGDVIGSGIQLFWAVSLCVLATALGSAGQIMVQGVEPSRRRLATGGAQALIVLLGVGAAWWGLDQIFSKPDTPRLGYWLAAYCFMAFCAGFGLTRDTLRSLEQDLDRGRVRRAMRDLLTIVAGGGFAIVLANMTVMMTSGFLDGRYQLTGVELPGRCENRVLWMGERALIVRCAERKPPIVLAGPENVMLTPIAMDEGLKPSASKP